MNERVKNRLLELRDEFGVSQEVVGGFVGLSQTRISAYERGRIIPSDILMKFAEYYNVTTDYILYLSDNKHGKGDADVNRVERNLIEFYRELEADGRAVVNGMVNGYEKRN